MRALFTFLCLIGCSVTLLSCSTAPTRYRSAPSTAPLRATVLDARGEIAQAKAAAGKAKLALATNDSATAAAELDTLTAHLLNAETQLSEKFDRAALQLDTGIAQQTAAVNTNADLAAIEKAKARSAAQWRNRFLLAGLALAAWIFRGPLLKLCGAAFKAARLLVGL